MKLFVVAFHDPDMNEDWIEPVLADDFQHAEEQVRDANPPNIEILQSARIPFHMVERAYYLAKERQARRSEV